MATKLASEHEHSYDSDTNASDYDFDLTAEEEVLLETLVATASTKSPVWNHSNRSNGAPLVESGFALRPDIAAVFATHHTSVNSIHDSEIKLELRAVHNDGCSSHVNDATVLPGLAAAGAMRSVDDGDDDEITAIVDEADRRMRQPVQVGGIRYPDLSRALSDTFAKPDSQAPDNDATVEHGCEQYISPLSRFRTYPKKPFSVSDLVAGAWCELQYFYTLTRLPGGKKTRTAAMKGGSTLHQKLEDEVHTTVTIEITKKEDAFGLKLWNVIQGLRTLRETGMTRELEVWGLVNGHVVNGVIDHLSYENPDPEVQEDVRCSQGGGQESSKVDPKEQKITAFFHSSVQPQSPRRQIFITDVKTRASKHIPSGAALRPTKIQLLLYHRFLSDMAAGRLDFLRVLERYGLDPDERFSDTFVAQIGSLHDEIFEDAVGDQADRDASFKASSSPSPDLIRYRTLRSVIPLLETELRLTFPEGAESVGSLLNVEYRKRARRTADGAGEDPDDGEAGALLGKNVMLADPEALDAYLARDLEWWAGERAPEGVAIEEAYKCRSCEFAEGCEWRLAQDGEMLAAARKRAAGRRRAVG